MAVKDLKADSSHTITIGNQRTRNNGAGHRKGNQEEENEDGTGSDSRFSNGSPSEASDPVHKEEAEKAKKKTANNNTKPLIRSREGTINDEQKELIDKVATVANAFSGKGKIDLRKGDKLGSSTVGVNKGKKVLAVVEDKGDGWSSTSEEVGNSEEFISNNCKEFSVVRGLSQGLGGNLFIDLGIGLAQERCLDSNVDPDEEDKSNSLDLTFNEDRRTISNTVSAQVNVSSENSESHVSDTWNTKNYGLGSQNNSTSESRMIKESKGGGKGLGTCKRHGMVTCKDKSKVSQDSKGPIKSGMIRSSASGYRAMEEEVEKIIEKGTELGVFKGSTGGLDKERSSNATIWSTPEEITRVI
ncbi:hypothetical protein LWI29_029733 [Acer saccharum]|uniref:Uncharacterized protein n=1 Tax=Acer saccharum TaxID=4024 RepID=A0AA39RNG3_ACESA|nr:hypothetical protein LWI29_029733 [Acer saccharum]